MANCLASSAANCTGKFAGLIENASLLVDGIVTVSVTGLFLCGLVMVIMRAMLLHAVVVPMSIVIVWVHDLTVMLSESVAVQPYSFVAMQ